MAGACAIGLLAASSPAGRFWSAFVMRPNIGFVLLTHEKPKQTLRLLRRINRLFDNPAIVNHHDFEQCPLNMDEFPNNVSFVVPSLRTEWGRFSSVEAVIRAIRQLYASVAPPDWFVLLSGSDYPIKPASQVFQDLATSPFDAHINHQLIQAGRFETEWQRLCYRRYFRNAGKNIIPFSDSFRCYAGEFWFCANSRVAEYIIDFHENNRYCLASHYADAPHPDESYFQTILANNRSLKLSNNFFRHIEWPDEPSSHPKTLSIQDLPRILASDAHFARKFDIDLDAAVLDAIDSWIDNPTPVSL
jgi:hypothetical protein